MEVTTNNVSYFDGAIECIGHLSIPESSNLLPLVLVAHTLKGRSEFEDQKVNALNALGYAALSIDIYGGGVMVQVSKKIRRLLNPLSLIVSYFASALSVRLTMARALMVSMLPRLQ